jgi:hypothetical protein
MCRTLVTVPKDGWIPDHDLPDHGGLRCPASNVHPCTSYRKEMDAPLLPPERRERGRRSKGEGGKGKGARRSVWTVSGGLPSLGKRR